MKRSLALVIAACGSHAGGAADAPLAPDAPGPASALAISLDRAAGSHAIAVTVHASDAAGQPVAGAAIALAVSGGTSTAVRDAGGGDYAATVQPDALDTEVTIVASTGALQATKVALALATIDDTLGQPEAVDGLVNSPGWEDGANISPDGQWLIVASYVPVDLLTCTLDGESPPSAACTTVIGPYAAPERPGMLGAERIHDGTFDNDCPDLGVTSPSTSNAFVPIAGYGFHRQADGSFAEPFVIGFDADGCLGPYGYAFTAAPQGSSAALVFANGDLGSSKMASSIWYTPITLGQPNLLGTYRIVDDMLQVTGFTPTELPPVLTTRQGNPFYSAGRLYWDDEDLAPADQDLYVADLTGTLPQVTAGPAQTVGVSLPGTQEIQPAVDGADLYWMGGGTLWRATLASGADPAQAASWSPRAPLLGPAAADTAPILALGEPNVAHVGGKLELYFVYIKQAPGGGYDANIGRVVAR
ncbi:MAG TPA: hypothetical protein VLX92_13625 [Kofleriaceae bacterium]|nr:hypothetical protein [Kofleriaceae bacterium]